MVSFENRIRIDCSRDEVFDFVSNFENIPKWNYYVESVRKVDHIPIGKGVRFHQIRKTDQQHFEIVEFERPSKVVVKTLESSLPEFTMKFEFEDKGDSTILIDTWHLETGRNPFFEMLGKSKIKAAVAENLSKLKELLETHRAHLQDGKMVTI